MFQAARPSDCKSARGMFERSLQFFALLALALLPLAGCGPVTPGTQARGGDNDPAVFDEDKPSVWTMLEEPSLGGIPLQNLQELRIGMSLEDVVLLLGAEYIVQEEWEPWRRRIDHRESDERRIALDRLSAPNFRIAYPRSGLVAYFNGTGNLLKAVTDVRAVHPSNNDDIFVRIQRLRIGMSTDEVRSILGEPTALLAGPRYWPPDDNPTLESVRRVHIEMTSTRQSTWRYGGIGLDLEFNSHGHLLNIGHKLPSIQWMEDLSKQDNRRGR